MTRNIPTGSCSISIRRPMCPSRAEDVRDGLKQLNLTGFLKTTGGKGLHVVVPFKKGPSWDEAKEFARTYSEAMAKAAPDRFTTNIRKAARTGKIFLAYVAVRPKYPQTIHYRGDGVFMVSGENTGKFRKLFKKQNL
jgi:hypothetical protein